MNTFRVDRNSSTTIVPCGMSSILCITDKHSEAVRVFNESSVGVDTWGKPATNYGLTLSKWDGKAGNYVVMQHRGITD